MADCGASRPVEEAVLLGDVVLVGTVTNLENGNRWATVRVEERWKGATDLPETVAVRGGPEPGAATAIDRTYSERRYLFIVKAAEGYLADDACSGTVAWTDDLSRLRPAGVSPAPEPQPEGPLSNLDSGDIAALAALVGALLVAVVAYIVILRARGRPPDWMR